MACSLDVFGDRWTLLVVRDLVMGAERFKEFAASPEGIPTNVLADRLLRLQHHEIVEQVSAADGTRHPAYRLTPKGRALYPVLEAMRDWGLAWEKGTKVMLRPRMPSPEVPVGKRREQPPAPPTRGSRRSP